MFNLFKKKKNTMSKEEIIRNASETFVKKFRKDAGNENHDVTEMTDDDIRNIINKYFEFDRLTDANDYFNHAFDEFVPDTYDKIDWTEEKSVREQTPEFIQWNRHGDVSSYWYYAKRESNIEKKWVDVHGKQRTDEEAATLAADKWCELLFGWHLQDNGALNETHPGGFTACALGTVLANKSKEGITDEMKVKTRELFIEYYRHYLHFCATYDLDDIKWANETMPDDEDKENPFLWKWGFDEHSMYCDYDPYMPLYLLLIAAGIPKSDAGSICPWKTGIYIRALDNAVMYQTYQKCEEI